MLGSLGETIKTLTFNYKNVLKSNIMSGNTSIPSMGGGRIGLSGIRSNSPSSMMVSNKLLNTYYIRLQEIKDYEVTELTNIAVDIIKDYIINNFNKENDIITLKGSEEGNELFKHQNRINKIFKELKIVEEIKSHLFEIIYNGQYCIKINWDAENRKFVKYDLHNPYNVVSVIINGKLDHHLVVSKDFKIERVTGNSIVRFGSPILHLINDMNQDYFSEYKKDTLVKNEELVAGLPLYYNIANKVKEYILKDQVVSLLAIKDLIQPLLLLIRLENSTTPEEANKFALHTENMINKHSDFSSILSANFSINDLMDSLINNIRVLPDYSSKMGEMNSIDLSKVTNKIAEIRGEQEAARDSILTSLGIPRTIFAGDVSKWEAIKASERLNSKVNTHVIQLKDGLKYTASMFYYMITGNEFNIEDIDCNLFTKTQVDYNTSIANAEIVINLLDSVNNIIDNTHEKLGVDCAIDREEYFRFVQSLSKIIDPDIQKFMGEKEIRLIRDTSEELAEGGFDDSGEGPSGFDRGGDDGGGYSEDMPMDEGEPSEIDTETEEPEME